MCPVLPLSTILFYVSSHAIVPLRRSPHNKTPFLSSLPENRHGFRIYDFIVEPPPEALSQTSGLFGVTRRLFLRELGRIYEFASLAVNGPEAMGKLLPLRDQLGLLDYHAEDDHGDS
jgi:hypothetical protein